MALVDGAIFAPLLSTKEAAVPKPLHKRSCHTIRHVDCPRRNGGDDVATV